MAPYRRIVAGLGTMLVLATSWYFATSVTGLVGPGRFPAPSDVWDALQQITITGYANGTLDQHVERSLFLVVASFLVSSAFGVLLGLFMGWNARIEALLNPLFLIIRPIPPLAWIPLAILWLGLGDTAKVMVIFFAAFVPAVINTHTGVKTIEPEIVEAARTLGTPRSRFLFEILIPGALPMIFTGLRLSLQASWTTLVAAELIGAVYGIGRVLNSAQQDIYPGMIFVGMLCVGVLGWTTTRLLAAVEARILSWSLTASATT